MDLVLYSFNVLYVSLSFISAEKRNSTLNGFNITNPIHTSESFTTTETTNNFTKRPTGHLIPTPSSQPPSNTLTMLAFGVMSFILILIIVMVILVTAVNLRGRCHNTKEDGVKSYESVISESNMTRTRGKENITLVSVRSIASETDSDSPQISSVHSIILDNEDQELSRDLLSLRVQ